MVQVSSQEKKQVWAKLGKPIPVLIKTEGHESLGEVFIQEYDEKARLKRALKMLGLCWAGALAAVFLPIVHFVLVPGLFLGGVFLAVYMHGIHSLVLGGEGVCPNCEKILPIAKGLDQWPLEDVCTACRSGVKIEKVTG